MEESVSGGSQRALALIKRLTGTGALVLVSVGIILFEVLLGKGGVVEIEPGEVAVIYNNTGIGIFGEDARTILEQGVQSFVPGMQTVQVLERRPQILVMAQDHSETNVEENHSNISLVRALTVRAKDGSNFYFDGLEIHYQIIPPEARTVIETSGPMDSYKLHLLATHSREVLRDEFGRFSFMEIANPTSYGKATSEAKSQLNERLAPYGVEVTQIITPKPKFEDRVEKAIEDRQNAEQEVEVQEEKRRKLESESKLKVQAIEQEKNAEYQALIAELESQKKASSNKLLSVKREADKYHIDQVAKAGAYRNEKVTRAAANEVAYKKEAEALVAKIKAVGDQGPDVLNAVIARSVMPQLSQVSATPLVKPTTPIDIRHLGNK